MRKLAFIAIATLALAACSSPAPVEKAPEPAKAEVAEPKKADPECSEEALAAFSKELAGAKNSNEARKMGKGSIGKPVPFCKADLAMTRANELQDEENLRRKKAEAKN